MQNAITAERFQAAITYEATALCELSDAELDAVAAGSGFHNAFAQVSIGNIAIGFQVNNQVNVAVLSLGVFQGGSQTNINNAGTIINLAGYF